MVTMLCDIEDLMVLPEGTVGKRVGDTRSIFFSNCSILVAGSCKERVLLWIFSEIGSKDKNGIFSKSVASQ